MHSCRSGRAAPKTNARYWQEKRRGNALRDKRNQRRLRGLGWGVLTVWECETRDLATLERRLNRFLADQKWSQ